MVPTPPPTLLRARLALVAIGFIIALWLCFTGSYTSRLEPLLGENPDPIQTAFLSSNRNHDLVLWIKNQNTTSSTLDQASLLKELQTALSPFAEIPTEKGIPESLWHRTFYPARFALDSISEADIRVRIAQLKADVSGPMSTVVSQTADQDPFQYFLDHLKRFQKSFHLESIETPQGRFTQTHSGATLIFLKSNTSGLDIEASRPLVHAIRKLQTIFEKRGITLLASGVHMHSVAREESIKHDIQLVSMLSSFTVVLLLWLFFRSIKIIAYSFLPILFGTALATASVHVVFGSVHTMTFVFGSTLIGVGIDFFAHFMNHHAMHPGQDAPTTSRAIRTGMTLAAVTTILGFLSLGTSSYPGFKQMALFTAVGVTASLCFTLWVLPMFLPTSTGPHPFHKKASNSSFRILQTLRDLSQHPVARWVMGFTCVGSFCVLPWVSFNDDIGAQGFDGSLQQHADQRIMNDLSAYAPGRFLLHQGATLNEAIALEEGFLAAHPELTEANSFALSRLIPSLDTQKRHLRTNAALLGSPTTTAALHAEGFDASLFVQSVDPVVTVDPDQISHVDPSFGTWLNSMVLSLPAKDTPANSVGLMTLLKPEIADHLEAKNESKLYSQRSQLKTLGRTFRKETLTLLPLSLLLVGGLIGFRHKHVGKTMAAFLPSVLACAFTLFTLYLLGDRLGMTHLLALVLVLTVGEDYGVFMVEEANPKIPFTGVLIAWLTTIASFGALALSQESTMAHFGKTVAIGITFAFLFSPFGFMFSSGKMSE